MRIDVLTLFPEACEPFFSSSVLGRARDAGIVTVACHNIRDHTKDPHGKVDDRPFGGGPGMVMMCQPVLDAVEAVTELDSEPPEIVLLTPQGEKLNQELAKELSGRKRLMLIAGHYEGFDERIRLLLSPREISIGDYVLSGGEAAAMVVVDAVVRLIPGALGDDQSALEESFSVPYPEAMHDESRADQPGLLEYPHYTRPREFRGLTVPEVLVSGNHGKVEAWRRAEALKRTVERRPDLLDESRSKNITENRRH